MYTPLTLWTVQALEHSLLGLLTERSLRWLGDLARAIF
jgi:hypothetical protein